MKHIFLLFVLLSSLLAKGQRVISTQANAVVDSRHEALLPENVIFYDGFENCARPALPNGWSTQSLASEGFVTGTTGTSSGQANENGFWAVPPHGIFAMANDDVCNCDKSKDRLTSRSFELTGIEALSIRFSAFQNGSGGQEAFVEVRAQGLPWTTIGAIGSSISWKVHQVSVPKAFLKKGFQFRFLYDDNGSYASGLAIDDVYLFEGESEKFSLEKTFSINGNEFGSGQLFHTIPLSQAREAQLQFGASINNETEVRKNARLQVTAVGPISYDQTSSTWMISDNAQKTIFINASQAFTPFEKGDYSISYLLETDSLDADVTDNSSSATFSVVDSVYAYVASSSENSTGVWLQGSGDRFGTAFYFHANDSMQALTVRIHPSSEAGAKFKVEVFDFDSISQQPLFSSQIIEVVDQDRGFDLRVPLSIAIEKGKHLIVVKKEPGPRRLVIGVNRSREAIDSNVIYKADGEAWKMLPYFPKLSLIFKPLDTNCLGTIQFTKTNESCVNSADGSVSLAVFGMDEPISYAWSNFAGNTPNNSGLNPGIYIVTVTDGNSCTYSKAFGIDSARHIEINPTILPDSCGKQIGSVDLGTTGGQEPYLVTWNLDTLSEVEAGLSLGQYAIHIADNNNCTLDSIIEVLGTEALSINFLTTEPNCLANNGAISAVISGTAPYTYAWNTGSTNSGLLNIVAGVYTLHVTDSIGCTTSEHVVLNNANAPSLIVSQANSPVCSNDATGEIILTVFGGTAPYTFEWSNGSLDQNLNDLPAGHYTVTVSDNLSCLNFSVVSLEDQSQPIESSFNARGVYCNADSSGAAHAVVFGGTGPYTFNWSNGNQSNSIDSAAAGNYVLTITDVNGCARIDSVFIAEGIPFFVRLDSVLRDTTAGIFPQNGVFLSTYGGTSPYSYNWDDTLFTEDLINVETGLYSLTLTDQLGCLIVFEYLLENGPATVNEISPINSVEMFPNPSSTLVTIRSAYPIKNITVHDISGRPIVQQKANNNEIELDTSSWTKGIYIVRVETTHSGETKQLIKI